MFEQVTSSVFLHHSVSVINWIAERRAREDPPRRTSCLLINVRRTLVMATLGNTQSTNKFSHQIAKTNPGKTKPPDNPKNQKVALCHTNVDGCNRLLCI